MTLVAIGTSLPELSIAISASIKKEGIISLGNLVGSNIINLSLIVGVASLINPINVSQIILYYIIPYLIFVILLAILRVS